MNKKQLLKAEVNKTISTLHKEDLNKKVPDDLKVQAGVFYSGVPEDQAQTYPLFRNLYTSKTKESYLYWLYKIRACMD